MLTLQIIRIMENIWQNQGLDLRYVGAVVKDLVVGLNPKRVMHEPSSLFP